MGTTSASTSQYTERAVYMKGLGLRCSATVPCGLEQQQVLSPVVLVYKCGCDYNISTGDSPVVLPLPATLGQG